MPPEIGTLRALQERFNSVLHCYEDSSDDLDLLDMSDKIRDELKFHLERTVVRLISWSVDVEIDSGGLNEIEANSLGLAVDLRLWELEKMLRNFLQSERLSDCRVEDIPSENMKTTLALLCDLVKPIKASRAILQQQGPYERFRVAAQQAYQNRMLSMSGSPEGPSRRTSQPIGKQDEEIRGASAKLAEAAKGVLDKDVELVRFLLEEDGDLAIDEKIVIAAARNHFRGKELMQILLDKKSDIPISEAVLVAAAGNLNSGKDVMKILLDRKSDLLISENVVAAMVGNPVDGEAMLELLMKREGDIPVGGAVLLALLAVTGNPTNGKQMLQTLLRQHSLKPLQFVVKSDNKAEMRLQLQALVWDRWDLMPLHLVVHKGYEVLVKVLLDTGKVDVNQKEKLGQTALHLAAERGAKTVVKLLLDTDKIAADSKDDYGRTPLHMAAVYGFEAVVKLLLDTDKVAVNSKDECGQTPLHLAAVYGFEAVVKLLLDTDKVAVDLKDRYGHTPLHIAARYGYEAVVKLLLDTGEVTVDLKDNFEQTPLRLAARYGYKAVVKLLLDTGEITMDSILKGL